MIYQFAGAIGVDPGPLTLRELFWMYDGHCRQAWGHTSNLMALIANVNRDPKKGKPFTAMDFNPFYVKKGSRPGTIHADTKDGIAFMREMFTGVKNGGK